MLWNKNMQDIEGQNLPPYVLGASKFWNEQL